MEALFVEETFLGLVAVLLCALAFVFAQPQSFDELWARRFPAPGRGLLRIYYHWWAAAFLLGLLPLGLVLLREGAAGPALLGLRPAFGPPGLLPVALLAAVALGALASTQAEFRRAYPLSRDGYVGGELPAYVAGYLLFYAGWELMFRGFIQLYLGRKIGAAPAMLLQTAASTLLHPNKPRGEVLAAVAGGPLFGGLALASDSIWLPFLAHAALGLSTDGFCRRRAA